MVRILPPEDMAPLDEACARAASFDWIVFASANAVDAFMDRLLRVARDLRILAGVNLAVVGPATAERLAHYRLRADLVPGEYRAEAVARAIVEAGPVGNRKVLLPRADIGREAIAEQLRHEGADVTEVVAYRTVVADAGRDGEPDVYRMLLDRRIDVVTFTSASAVRNFVKIVGAEPAADLLRTTAVASIGPLTAEAAVQCGIDTTIRPAEYTVPSLVEAIADYFAKQQAPA
jgi:uroporphyrinogen III methyltransferase/synthase